MKKEKIITRCLCLIVFGGFILYSPLAGPAKENAVLWTQGRINPGGNLKAGYLLINEMRVYLNPSTQIMDHHGKMLTSSELRPKKWVYVGIEKDTATQALRTNKIYLLPHYIVPEKKKQYAFMK